MEIDPSKLQRLKCSVKNYDWGRPARASKVARLFFANSRSGTGTRDRRRRGNIEPEPDKPYAEFWIGTHDSGPSFLIDSDENETLKSWLSRNPHVLGEKAFEKWGSDLPFLIKVLSVGKASPIQAHHQKHGMALAITEFEALCGFIPLEEMQAMVNDVPEIWNLIGFGTALSVLNHSEENVELQYSSMFTRLMSADKDKVTVAVGKLKTRLTQDRQGMGLTDKEKLALRLEEQYPGDIGVIASFFLNYVKLDPDEAINIGPNEPHAYISGECIECMIESEHGDTQTLWRGPLEIMRGNVKRPCVTEYLPPFSEFEIHRCHLPISSEKLTFRPTPTPSIFLVTGGTALIEVRGTNPLYGLREGDVIFAAANTPVPICGAVSLILYRVGVNKFFSH